MLKSNLSVIDNTLTVKVYFEDETYYDVDVKSSPVGKGTETMITLPSDAVRESDGKIRSGSTIMLNCIPNPECVLDEVIISDSSHEIILNENNSIKCILYKLINDTTFDISYENIYSINIDSNDGGTIITSDGALEATYGSNVTLKVEADNKYFLSALSIIDEVTDLNIKYTNNNDGTYSFIMPDNNVTIQGIFEKEKNKNSSSVTSNKTPKSEVEKAIADAKPNDNGVIETKVKVDVDNRGRATIKLPKNYFENDNPVELTIETRGVNITLSSEMFTGNEENIELVIEPCDKENLNLSDEAKELIGDMPVYQIYLKIDGKKTEWKGDKQISISIGLDNEDDNKDDHKFVAVYYDEKGNMKLLKFSFFSEGVVHFKTMHLSNYGVVYVDKSFEDCNNHWAKEAIEALAARGVINGTSDTTFSPQNKISRADFVTLIVRYFGFKGDNISNFNDVAIDKYYSDSIAIAKDLGIVKGNNNNLFNPLKPITRQDMMVILQRALKISGEDLELKKTNKAYTSFNDSNKVADYAIESVDYMINMEIIKGDSNNINPTSNTTRAEVAQMLYNLLKKIYKD